ncbi:peptidase [Pseudophaeobacter sp.]|uniref:peptidase n=1 Tax=Pseudophaeobacter sp. TaxID=1971739 RepID=UPI0032975F7F
MNCPDLPETPLGLRAVAEARSWLGTPYLHQASCRGAGCDCLGLIRGIWRGLYGSEPEQPPAYTMDWSEPQQVEVLWQAALRHLQPKPLQNASLGDVLLFRMRAGAVAKHLGLQTRLGDLPSQRSDNSASQVAGFIHAYHRQGVVESVLTSPWQRRIVARFTFPEELS